MVNFYMPRPSFSHVRKRGSGHKTTICHIDHWSDLIPRLIVKGISLGMRLGLSASVDHSNSSIHLNIEVDHSNDGIYIWIVKLTIQMKLLLPWLTIMPNVISVSKFERKVLALITPIALHAVLAYGYTKLLVKKACSTISSCVLVAWASILELCARLKPLPEIQISRLGILPWALYCGDVVEVSQTCILVQHTAKTRNRSSYCWVICRQEAAIVRLVAASSAKKEIFVY